MPGLYLKIRDYQNQKKQIATFTKGSKSLGQGLMNDTDVLVELKGYTVLHSDFDLYSQLSRNGYRWIDPTGTPLIRKIFSDKIEKKLTDYFLKIPEFVDFIKENGLPEHKFNMKNEESTGIARMFLNKLGTGKMKQEFIKFYFDESKNLINKKLIDELKKATIENFSFSHDELLLHDYTITGAWTVLDGYEDSNYSDLFNEYNIKNCGLLNRSKIKEIDIQKNKVPKC